MKYTVAYLYNGLRLEEYFNSLSTAIARVYELEARDMKPSLHIF